MNMDNVYKIKKNLRVPMVLATLISIPVFLDVVMAGFNLSVLLMALLLMVLFYLLTINNMLRLIRVTTSDITIRGLLGSRKIPVGDITRLEGITMGTRQFITLSTGKRNYLIPNSFENFEGIISDMESVVKDEAIGAGLAPLKENLIVRKSDVTGVWITVILLVIIIVIRFFPR
jgi:ABC-type multidrug transport system fused ATPase/permease subunit